jgi:hypothetical protein
MCLLLREALTVGKIAYHRNFLSVELNGPEAKKALQDEMLNVCANTNPTHPHVLTAPCSTVLRGDRGGQDDLWKGCAS